jgi:hypothetical protein
VIDEETTEWAEANRSHGIGFFDKRGRLFPIEFRDFIWLRLFPGFFFPLTQGD